MIISLNSFVINDPNSPNGVYLNEPLDGLGMAPLRTSSGNNSGSDGGWIGGQFYGIRVITLTGEVRGTTPADLDAKRQAFLAAVATSPITMNITTTGGAQYTMNTYLDAPLDMPMMATPTKSPFSLTLIALDATIYDASAGGMHTATVNRAGGGGLTWPLTWPLTWAGGSGPTTVSNTGPVIIYPVITLTGSMTNPIITNQTTGQFFALSPFTTGSSDVLVIDMKNRTVLLNGSSVLPARVTTSTWWALLSGNNVINLTTASSGDTVVATVQWRTGVRGI